MEEQGAKGREDREGGAPESKGEKPQTDVADHLNVVPLWRFSRHGRTAVIPDEPESEGDRAQVDAAPQEKRNLPSERHCDDRGRRHPQDDAGVAEGAERELELQEGDLARNHGDRAVVREMIQGIREEDPPGAGHDEAMTERLKSLVPVGKVDQSSVDGPELRP